MKIEEMKYGARYIVTVVPESARDMVEVGQPVYINNCNPEKARVCGTPFNNLAGFGIEVQVDIELHQSMADNARAEMMRHEEIIRSATCTCD